MKMKNLSVAIVLTAALAAGAIAQQNNKDNKKPKPVAQKHVTKPAPKAAPKAAPKFGGTSPTVTKPAGHTTHPAPSSFGNQNKPLGGQNGIRVHQGVTGTPTTGPGKTNPSGHKSGAPTTGTPTTFKPSGRPLTGAVLHTGNPVSGKPGVFALKNAPAIQRGVNAPAKSAFVHPTAPISSSNYPAPHSGNTYITNNTTVINNNYNYDAQHYQPHVSNFYGYQNPGWGGHWRYGCYQPAGVSVTFGFGFYVYTPFYAACVASPFYYYPGVPAYIPQSRVQVFAGYDCNWGGNPYAYRFGTPYGSYGVPTLNHVVDTIHDVFANADPNSLRSIIGGNQIAVFSEGNYEYSLNGTEFLQMLTDNIAATQTASYNITKVRQYGIYAVVEAAHTFNDPASGGQSTVYHRFRLQENSYNWYTITDFMTSHTPFGPAAGSAF